MHLKIWPKQEADAILISNRVPFTSYLYKRELTHPTTHDDIHVFAKAIAGFSKINT